MYLFSKAFPIKIAVSILATAVFIFVSQQSPAQNTDTKAQQSLKKEVESKKRSLENEQNAVKTNVNPSFETRQANQKRSATKAKLKKKSQQKEVKSDKKATLEEQLVEVEKRRNEIALQKAHGKLTNKEFQDAVNKLDKMEKAFRSNNNTQLDAQEGK